MPESSTTMKLDVSSIDFLITSVEDKGTNSLFTASPDPNVFGRESTNRDEIRDANS